MILGALDNLPIRQNHRHKTADTTRHHISDSPQPEVSHHNIANFQLVNSNSRIFSGDGCSGYKTLADFVPHHTIERQGALLADEVGLQNLGEPTEVLVVDQKNIGRPQ